MAANWHFLERTLDFAQDPQSQRRPKEKSCRPQGPPAFGRPRKIHAKRGRPKPGAVQAFDNGLGSLVAENAQTSGWDLQGRHQSGLRCPDPRSLRLRTQPSGTPSLSWCPPPRHRLLPTLDSVRISTTRKWRVRLQRTSAAGNLSTLRLRYQVPKINTASAEQLATHSPRLTT